MNRVPQARRKDRPICGRCKAHLGVSGAPQEVDARALRDAIESSPVPVLVDFWAPWCGPCRVAAPSVERIAKARAGLLVVLKANTEDHPELGGSYRIQGIPAFLMFRGGREVSRQVGVLPETAFGRWVDGFALAA